MQEEEEEEEVEAARYASSGIRLRLFEICLCCLGRIWEAARS